MECELYLKWDISFYLADRFAQQMEERDAIVVLFFI